MGDKVNSSGERLYRDSTGASCNLRGMIQREPEWVMSRFVTLEAENAKLWKDKPQCLHCKHDGKGPTGAWVCGTCHRRELCAVETENFKLRAALVKIATLCESIQAGPTEDAWRYIEDIQDMATMENPAKAEQVSRRTAMADKKCHFCGAKESKVPGMFECGTSDRHIGYPYYECLRRQLATLKADGITGETQDRIHSYIVEQLGVDASEIDGSGCDSGDPVDLTLDEIGQGLGMLQDQLTEAKTALATAKADALTGAADYFETEGDRPAHKNRYPWDWAAKMLRRRADEAQQAQQGEPT